MNFYYIILFFIFNQIFFIKKFNASLLLFSMISTIFLILILPVEIEFIRYVFLGMSFILYLAAYLLLKTFPSLAFEKRVVGKRWFSFSIIIISILVFALWNILNLNLPGLFKSSLLQIQGVRVLNSTLITVIGIMSVLITFVFSELRDGGETNDN